MTDFDKTRFHTSAQENADTWFYLARDIFLARPSFFHLSCTDSHGVPLLPFRRAAHSAGYRFNISQDVMPTVEIEGSWENFLAGMNESLIARLEVARQAVERLGDISFHVVCDSSPLFDSALQLLDHGSSAHRLSSLLQLTPQSGLYANIARSATHLSMLRMFLLLLDGEPIAMCIALEHADRVHLLKAAGHPLHLRHGAGLLLLHAALDYCFHCGAGQVQFNQDVRLDAAHWCNGLRPCVRFEAFDASITGALRWASQRYVRTMHRPSPAKASRKSAHPEHTHLRLDAKQT